jgi:hypothetical protein
MQKHFDFLFFLFYPEHSFLRGSPQKSCPKTIGGILGISVHWSRFQHSGLLPMIVERAGVIHLHAEAIRADGGGTGVVL